MLKTLAKGLFGRLLGYAAFGLGFWLLFQGISRPNIGLMILGGGMLLASMYLMVSARRIGPASGIADPADEKEDASSDLFANDSPAGDLLNGSDQGDKLPP